MRNNPLIRVDADGHCCEEVQQWADETGLEPVIVGAAAAQTLVTVWNNRDAIVNGLQATASAYVQAGGPASTGMYPTTMNSSNSNAPAPATTPAPAATPAPATAPGFVGDAGGNVVQIPAGSVPRPAENGNGTVYQPPVPAGAHPDANAVRVMGPTAKQPTGSITVHGPTGQPINPATGKPDSRPNTHTPIKPTSTNP